MKILFIAENFAPDSVIGAVRIIKFAKYLYHFGNDVSVLCSAKCIGKRDDTLLKELQGINIYRFDEDDGDKKATPISKRIGEDKESVLCYQAKMILKKTYKQTLYPIKYFTSNKEMKNNIIEYYNSNLVAEKYDVLFATFSPLATVMAAMEITEKSRAKLIIDFRDLMDGINYPFFIRKKNYSIQRKIIERSDIALTVSEGQKNILQKKYGNLADKVIVLNNGYDGERGYIETAYDCAEFVIAYTGSLYTGRRNLTPLLKAISKISERYAYKFRVIYAGTESKELYRQLALYHLEGILDDRGVLSRAEVENVQCESDIFLVATWNTKNEQGIMTGKFYEGIRIGKPIVVLVNGDEPGSDLYKLYKEYDYGYCYEECRDDGFDGLYNFILKKCQEKEQTGHIVYHQSEALEKRFQYKSLARKLEGILQQL